MPVAFLPVVKFIHENKRMTGVLSDRLYHQCLDIVVDPLKIAARIGVMLSDPLGNQRYCFTPLAACIVDSPEACLIACVRGKTSPVTLANYTEFGDDFQHPPRTKASTLNSIASVTVDPAALVAHFEACAASRLNGVHLPFWRNWLLSEPARFLPPEVLHLFHRSWYDHDCKWCIKAVGAMEIDFRFSIVPHITGYRHFGTGITALKQVTGRTQRDLQRYIIAVIAGAAPVKFIRAVRALLQFRYLSQAPVLDEDACRKVSASLAEFHTHKQAIIDAGARCGESGNILNHWQIPKLEMMQSVASSIPAVGPPINWSADTTERAHIDCVKNPAAATNHNDFESQICRYLDRHEKCRAFSLALSLRENELGLTTSLNQSDDFVTGDCLPDKGLSDSVLGNPSSSSFTNYFEQSGDPQNQRFFPPRTFTEGPVAFHLNNKPVAGSMDIDEVARHYALPDLRAALVNYIYRRHNGQSIYIGGRRQYRADHPLPFEKIQVWHKVRLQQKSFHDTSRPLPSQALNAHGPSTAWPKGRYDAAFVNVDPDEATWPRSGLRGSLFSKLCKLGDPFQSIAGHTISELRLIFLPVPTSTNRQARNIRWKQEYLVYVARFKVQAMDAVTGMHTLKRVTPLAFDILPLRQLRALAPIVPKFGAVADPRLTSRTSSTYSHDFYLNCFFTKELFYALDTS